MAMEQLRVGIIGCGKIATVDHIPGLLAVEGVSITALCDVVAGAMTAVQREFPVLAGATCFEDAAELIGSGRVDAAVVATPNDCHHPQTLAACRAGLHVLCEKPMAATLDEATAMIEAAREAGVVLQINQSMKYNATYQAVVRLVKEGRIGEPFHARCIRAGDRTPNEGWSPGADWFVQERHQGGLLLDIGIHMADVLRMLLGEADKVAGLVDTRRADIDVPDNVNALFRFKNGGTAMLELSWTLPGGAGFLEVYGTKGRIRMGFGESPIELWTKGKGKPEEITPEAGRIPSSQRVFCDAIRGKAVSRTPGEYGRRALALCTAIQESSDTGRFADVVQFEKGV